MDIKITLSGNLDMSDVKELHKQLDDLETDFGFKIIVSINGKEE